MKIINRLGLSLVELLHGYALRFFYSFRVLFAVILFSILFVACRDRQNQEILTGTKWECKIAEDCINVYEFPTDSTYKFISCEMEDEYFGKYRFIGDTLILERQGSIYDTLYPEDSAQRAEKKLYKARIKGNKLTHISVSHWVNGKWVKSDFKFDPEYVFTKKTIEAETAPEKLETRNSIIKGSIGVVSVTENITDKDTIKILNEGGSIWYKFSFFYDESDGKFDFPNDSFRPFAFNPDYFLLVLRVTNETSNGYEVIVNEETGEKKYIEKNGNFLFQTWEAHILSVFSVGFDEASNPLLESPSGGSEKAHYDNDGFYYPAQIKGEWLQIKWGSEDDWNYGWIRWKDGEKLLIELHYFS